MELFHNRSHQQRLHIQPLRKTFITLYNILLKFIILYFNNFILLRPENLYVILARHNELPEDDILNVETCTSMLFVIIMFDVIVQTVGQIVNKKVIPIVMVLYMTNHRKDNIKQGIKCEHDVIILVVAQLGLITSKTYNWA